MSKSLIQEEKECFVCHTRQNLHRHHIFFGAYRKKSEEWGCWCYLCGKHHNLSNAGVHYNHDLDLMLKRVCQMEFEKKYGEELFMKTFGRNWL
jgi:hypothetical protein